MESELDSEKFREELASSDSGQLMLSAMEKLSDGVSIFGPNFEPIYANRKSKDRFNRMYKALNAGACMQDALRGSVRAVMPHFSDEEVAAAARAVYQATLRGEPIDLKTQDGRIVQVTYSQLESGQRVAISVDITELREREYELKAARKEADAANASKSAFLANTSHEIRTPLNAILGLAQVLEKHDLPGEVREHVASILDAGKTLTVLLNDVLDLSKIEAGKLEILPIDADLSHAMRRILQLWRPRAEEKRLDFGLTVDVEAPPFLHFDPIRVRQCVSNLVSNAIKFTDRGGVEISVRVNPLNGGDYMVAITVKDTGIGIPLEAQKRLFQPFVQADASTSRQFGGTGLGLAISRKLAQEMGGDITVESKDGEGAAFKFTFVAKAAESKPGVVADEQPRPLQSATMEGLRVLVVDDIPINRQIASLFLRPLGCKVTEAENGAVALEKLAAEEFDIVLLDVHMPVLDGIETIKQIRASAADWRNTKVIALTADAMSGDRERYLSFGMNGYISKPINENEMIAEMRRLLGGDAPAAQANA